ncbi:MAG: Uma2 family endonuclease [Spirochaetaceae bacterium]|nr:Uma2 family endonuclease [Spirochaetaceae bacterium]
MASPPLAPAKVHYPSSDGKPMAESDFQRTPLTYAVDRLRQHFRSRRDVYVSGNLLLYYEEGNPRAVVAPDVFVVLGAPNADRSIYRLWEEPKGPDFVLEITSRTTYREDQGRKRELYRSLGVQEYWQYDPTGDYLEPRLQGLELSAGEYRRLPGRELADGTLALASAVLGLELRLTERGLRFHDIETGMDLPNLAETDEARERERQARERERQARHAAEKRLAEEAAAREQEVAAREAAEARVAELEALLRRQRGSEPGQEGNRAAPR